jgi:hypothetical protein
VKSTGMAQIPPALRQGAKPIELCLERPLLQPHAGVGKALQGLKVRKDAPMVLVNARAGQLAGVL